MLSESLLNAVKSVTFHKSFLEVIDYAVLPAGKLFRPRLVEAIALDIALEINPNHLHLASALELHHAYSLVHDDLPSMDNDLIRRGRPSTHAAYGEWKAILTGDALLVASFGELFKIDHPKYKTITKLFAWATGAKGLVLGQYMDLDAHGKLDIAKTIRIHELKTARLIQIATVGGYFLSSKEHTLRGVVEFLRLGREIGVSFQLLDDLGELTGEISEHERQINPFLLSGENALEEMKLSIRRLKEIVFRQRLIHLEKMLTDYFKKNKEQLILGMAKVELNLKSEELSKDLKDWLTTFV